MNLANKITISRALLIPIFLVVLLNPSLFGNYNRYVSCVLFIIAASTDAIDGYIARSKNMITNFGKFMDPLVDKLLVTSALIALVELNNISSWVVIVIVLREFIVTGLRLVAVSEGVVISANNLGKIKTITQMIMTCLVILNFDSPYFILIKNIFVVIVLFFTIVSGYDYIAKNKHVFK